MSPALAYRVFTTETPGKPFTLSVNLNNIVVFPIHAKSLRDHKASQGSKSPSYFDPATLT